MKPLRLGIAGLGTVGVGVVKIIQQHAEVLAARSGGRAIEITAVSARDAGKDRGVDISAYAWVDNAADLAARDDVDVVVELIGGSEGLALTLVKAALESGKHVVTANKALLAHHGHKLASIAESKGVSLNYEAAVAGGIPVIKSIREAFAGNQVNAVYGILNGTCNYMLTAMRETGKPFDEILKEAQEAGYAEADPTFDVDGIDAGHKLALLSSIAFGVKPDFTNLDITGIRAVTATDIKNAGDLGYRIKLLGIAKRIDDKILQVMEPCLVPLSNPMGVIEDVYNALYVDCDAVETTLMTGKGAGQGPTASAVMSDVVDIARGFVVPTFGVPAAELKTAEWMDLNEMESRYYLRLMVTDKAGVIADVSAILKQLNISIDDLVQHAQGSDEAVAVVLTTDTVKRGDMMDAVEMFRNLTAVVEEPCLMRIEELE